MRNKSQRSKGSHTYIVLLKLGQLIIDVNDLDDNLTICAEFCERKAIKTSSKVKSVN